MHSTGAWQMLFPPGTNLVQVFVPIVTYRFPLFSGPTPSLTSISGDHVNCSQVVAFAVINAVLDTSSTSYTMRITPTLPPYSIAPAQQWSVSAAVVFTTLLGVVIPADLPSGNYTFSLQRNATATGLRTTLWVHGQTLPTVTDTLQTLYAYNRTIVPLLVNLTQQAGAAGRPVAPLQQLTQSIVSAVNSAAGMPSLQLQQLGAAMQVNGLWNLTQFLESAPTPLSARLPLHVRGLKQNSGTEPADASVKSFGAVFLSFHPLSLRVCVCISIIMTSAHSEETGGNGRGDRRNCAARVDVSGRYSHCRWPPL